MKRTKYAKRRANLIYYSVVRRLATALAPEASSVIDVGSHDTPCLNWFPSAKRRVSLDLKIPLRREGIEAIETNFLTWQPDQRFDLALCLQVLEHVPDAAAFAQKLLATANIVVASVPYKWKAGGNPTHIHDPVDLKKVNGWFGRAPQFTYRCREIVSVKQRLICVFEDPSIPAWKSLRERSKLIGQSDEAPAAT